jgi:hypothetical protein
MFNRSKSYGKDFPNAQMFQVFSGAKEHQPDLFAAMDETQLSLAFMITINITLMSGLLSCRTT